MCEITGCTLQSIGEVRKHLIKIYHVTNNTTNVSIFQGENVSVTIQNERNSENIDFDLIFFGCFNATFSYIMATSFSGGRSRNTRREPPTMDKQLVIFITCGCESIAPFLSFTKPGANPRCISDRLE